MEKNSPESLSKYQKLALEYSKLKAQSSVLKTALSEEQTTSSGLQETLKKKELIIRKLEQEVDCLNFRNQQLAKRVSILQTDLEAVDSSIKSTKNKSKPLLESSDSYGVLNTELQSRIKENETLHHQLYALDEDHRKEVSELSSTVESLQSELSNQEFKLNATIEEQQRTINSLLKEKIRMQGCLKINEIEIGEMKLKEEAYEADMSLMKRRLMSQLENANHIVSEKVVFNDTQSNDLNRLNVPTLVRRRENQVTVLLLKLCNSISQFAQQLSDLHMHMEQKIRVILRDNKVQSILKKFEQFLHEVFQHLKGIEMSFGRLTTAIQEDVLTASSGKCCVQEISFLFSKYVSFLDKLLPYLILSIQMEDAMEDVPQKVKHMNQKLSSLLNSLICCFKRLDTYVHLIFDIVSTTKEGFLSTRSSAIIKLLSNLDRLQGLFDEARKCLGSKMSVSHPLATTSEAEKKVDECLLSSLVSLSSTLQKFTSLIEENTEVFCGNSHCLSRQTKFLFDPCVAYYKERGAKYMIQIPKDECPSVPYRVALDNSQTLCNYSDIQENLTQQLEEYRNKLSHLELEKENWMLECEFLKAKQSKNRQSPTTAEDDSMPDYEALHLFAKDTVNQLIKQIQFADSKVIAYRNESESLFQKLKMTLQKEKTLENDALSANKLITCMKEEQTTLMKYYEDQLSTMSEHLANMNDVITVQNDEIDALKQMTNHKGTKKGKGK